MTDENSRRADWPAFIHVYYDEGQPQPRWVSFLLRCRTLVPLSMFRCFQRSYSWRRQNPRNVQSRMDMARQVVGDKREIVWQNQPYKGEADNSSAPTVDG